ncbi:MAG TPA: NF038122 family metalloprotease, partial [Xanthobacteraceae bacterium]|nr:NF038122 family metalloprotease [Xanthobacteraceae bacterium]
MIINLELDTAAQAAPAAVKAIWQEAANIIGSMFTDNITINLSVDYSGTGGGASAGPTNGVYESYSTVYSYLKGGASPGDSSFTGLPLPSSANAPTEVGVWNAELKAMSAAGSLTPGSPGYLSPTGSEIDGNSFFDTDISLNSLLGVALHEFTHAMGRVPFTDGSGDPDVMELERFTSVGNRLSNNSIPAPASYFSLNGGATSWAAYGQGSDPSDYLNSQNYSGYGSSPLSPEDAFNEFYDGNTLQYLTPVDLEQMDVLGFHLKQDAPASDPYDFNGDNSGDILLEGPGGQIEYANMANGTFQGIVSVTNLPGWNVVGEGKISGGVDSDIVIQNTSTGLIQYCFLSNGGFLSTFVTVGDPTGFVVVGVGDIADNHYTDIVIQNPVTDEVGYANMNNGVFNNWFSVADPV